MSNLPQQDTIIQYIADGITARYQVPFYTPLEIDGTPDMDVYTQAPTAPAIPTVDINIWNVAYIYTPNLDPTTGGYITFQGGYIPTSGWIITIVRNVQASLNVEFANAQMFSGITLDNALQRLLLISQQNKSYAFDRNISYIVNSYIPSDVLNANVQVPILQAQQVWMGSVNGIIAATLEQPADVSTLRSELANNSPDTDGARLVGYYDPVNVDATTVDAQLTYLTNAVVAPFPTGSIIDFAGTSPPAGFLVCDGSSLLRSTYPDLFSVIGTTWGSVDGSHFNLPQLQRAVTMGSGGTGTAIIGNAVGNTYTSETCALTDPLQLPSHSHTPSSIVTTANYTTSNVATGDQLYFAYGSHASNNRVLTSTTTFIINPTGASAPFNIIQTSAIVLKCIKT